MVLIVVIGLVVLAVGVFVYVKKTKSSGPTDTASTTGHVSATPPASGVKTSPLP